MIKEGHSNVHLTATPTFVITPQYGPLLEAHPSVVAIKAAITAAITVYQNALSTTGTANILFEVMTTGLGTEILLRRMSTES